jgi:hypothetical protein
MIRPAPKRSIGHTAMTAVIAVIALSSTFTSFPRPAHALFGDDAVAVKEYVLDPLAYVASKVVLQSVTKSVVNWVNSGFKGSPAFATDLNKNLQSVSDGYAAGFLRQFNSNSSVNSPFRDVISAQLKNNYYKSSGKSGFFDTNKFTLGQKSKNPTAFLNGDFSQGGFNAFLAAGQNCGTNPYCLGNAAGEQLAGGVAKAADTRKTELNWGQGWLSSHGTCDTAEQLAQSDSAVELGVTDTCDNSQISTPGSVIHDQAVKVFGSGVDQLVAADEINEILGTLMAQMVSKTLTSGLSSLSSKPSSGGSSFISQATDPSQYATAATAGIAANLGTTIDTQASSITLYQTSWTNIQAAALSAKTACVSNPTILTNTVQPVLTRASAAITKAATTLAALAQIKTTLIAAQAPVGTTGATSALTNKNQTAAFQSVATQYTAAQQNAPSPDEITFGIAQSQISTTTTPTLYTQMTTLANNGCKSS